MEITHADKISNTEQNERQIIALIAVAWPSGLRRWFQAPVILWRGFESHRCQLRFINGATAVRCFMLFH